MKNKKIFALIAGLICLVVLISVSIGSCSDKPEDTDPQDQAQQGTNGETQQPEQNTQPEGQDPEEQDSEDQTPEQADPKPNEQVDPETDEPSTSTTPVTLDYTTKEGIEAILNDPYMILVNRDHRVDSDYEPTDLVSFRGGYELNRTCSEALGRLIDAGEKAGYSYTLYSGYRTYSSQYNKYYNKIAYWQDQGYSEEKAIELTNEYYAPPGASEHHTGLAADVCIPSIVNKYACLHENYDQTEEFKWFSENAHKYGFILRYSKGNESITGYNYEPWHYRYVGVEIATDIYNRGITMEEYVADLEAKLAAFE